MGIKFLCPNGHKMNVKAFLAGKRGKCPKCGASVRIPQETPASDSGEDLLADAPEPAAQPSVGQATGNTSAASVPSGPAVSVAASPVQPAAAAYTVPTVRPVLPVGAPAIPTIAAMTQPTGPAVMRGPQPVSAPLPMGVDPISQAPNSIWYVRPPSGGQYGPARGDIMRKWVSEGRVSGDSLVWREGFPEWKSAAQLFPSLAVAGDPATAVGPPPPPETAEIPKVTRSARKLNAYEAKKSQGNGVAVAILIVLGIICVGLVIGLVYVLSQGSGGTHKEAPKKTAAVTHSTAAAWPAPREPSRRDP